MPERDEETERPADDETVYPDGSVAGECWSEPGYTTDRTPAADDEGEDLRVLKGE